MHIHANISKYPNRLKPLQVTIITILHRISLSKLLIDSIYEYLVVYLLDSDPYLYYFDGFVAGFLCPLSANTFGIDFLNFTISDYISKKTIFEVSYMC